MSNLALIKQEMFGTTVCDFYKNEKSDVFMTRDQIGLALEYAEPMKAIAKIHERHSDRLDKFSFPKLTNGREIYFYKAKGIYEICRWSRQEKANEFMDWVWDVIETIRKTGSYTLNFKESFQLANLLSRTSIKKLPVVAGVLKQSGIDIDLSFMNEKEPKVEKEIKLNEGISVVDLLREYFETLDFDSNTTNQTEKHLFVRANHFRKWLEREEFSPIQVVRAARDKNILIYGKTSPSITRKMAPHQPVRVYKFNKKRLEEEGIWTAVKLAQ